MALVIKGGTVYTMGPQGVVDADVLLEDGLVSRVAPGIEPAPGDEVVDATGCVVTPGLVDAHSHIGGFQGDDQDLNELTRPRTPELDALHGIDPRSDDFSVALSQGITTSLLVPGSGNVVGGWGVVLKSAGDSLRERVVRHPAVLKAATGINPKGVYSKTRQAPMTRMAINHLLRSYLSDVRDYAEAKRAAERGEGEAPERDEALEHGVPVIERRMPLKVHSYMHDMTQVVEIARDFDVEVTIDHAQGASDFYDDLCDPHVRGVVFGPVNVGLFPGEGGIIDYECLKGLDDRGVDVCVMTDGPVSVLHMLVFEMGEAVRCGMDPVRALGMVTCNPARVLGVDERVGSLEPGKDADACVWTALPSLACDASLRTVVLDGRVAWGGEC